MPDIEIEQFHREAPGAASAFAVLAAVPRRPRCGPGASEEKP